MWDSLPPVTSLSWSVGSDIPGVPLAAECTGVFTDEKEGYSPPHFTNGTARSSSCLPDTSHPPGVGSASTYGLDERDLSGLLQVNVPGTSGQATAPTNLLPQTSDVALSSTPRSDRMSANDGLIIGNTHPVEYTAPATGHLFSSSAIATHQRLERGLPLDSAFQHLANTGEVTYPLYRKYDPFPTDGVVPSYGGTHAASAYASPPDPLGPHSGGPPYASADESGVGVMQQMIDYHHPGIHFSQVALPHRSFPFPGASAGTHAMGLPPSGNAPSELDICPFATCTDTAASTSGNVCHSVGEWNPPQAEPHPLSYGSTFGEVPTHAPSGILASSGVLPGVDSVPHSTPFDQTTAGCMSAPSPVLVDAGAAYYQNNRIPPGNQRLANRAEHPGPPPHGTFTSAAQGTISQASCFFPNDGVPAQRVRTNKIGSVDSGCSEPLHWSSTAPQAHAEDRRRNARVACPNGNVQASSPLKPNHEQDGKYSEAQELCDLVNALLARFQRYKRFKDARTERYLMEIERKVDTYLLKRYGTPTSGDGRWSSGTIGNRLEQAGATLRRVGMSLLRGTGGDPPSTSLGIPQSMSDGPSPFGGSHTDVGCLLSISRHSSKNDMVGAPRERPLHFTPDAIPPHYLDERPTDEQLEAVQANYPVLLHVLDHFFLPEMSAVTHDGEFPSSSPPADTPPNSIHHASPLQSRTFSAVDTEHAAIHYKLVGPLIRAVWRDHLGPFLGKLNELRQIAEGTVMPALEQYRSAHPDAAGSTVSPSDVSSLMGSTVSHVEQCFLVTAKMIQTLQKDHEYLLKIQEMDNEFMDVETGKREPRTLIESKRQLSNYVPVYGLILSRLHRLEVEHRTMLEVWMSGRTHRA